MTEIVDRTARPGTPALANPLAELESVEAPVTGPVGESTSDDAMAPAVRRSEDSGPRPVLDAPGQGAASLSDPPPPIPGLESLGPSSRAALRSVDPQSNTTFLAAVEDARARASAERNPIAHPFADYAADWVSHRSPPASADIERHWLSGGLFGDIANGDHVIGALLRNEQVAPEVIAADRQAALLTQRLLTRAGFGVAITGEFDDATVSATRAAQQRLGLSEHGRIDGPTLVLLAALSFEPGERASALMSPLDLTIPEDLGPWEATSDWTQQNVRDLGQFAHAFALTNPDSDARTALLSFARQRDLPLGASELGISGSVAVHAAGDPLAEIQSRVGEFSDTQAEEVWRYNVANAELAALRQDKEDKCLPAMRRVLKLLLEERYVRVGNNGERQVRGLQLGGLAGATETYLFLDENGNRAGFVAPPASFAPGDVVSDGLRSQIGLVPGWQAFSLTLVDSYHVLLFVVDNRDPASPNLYWADNWRSTRGWKQVTFEGADNRVLENVIEWWEKVFEETGVRYNTKSELTKILP